MAGQREQRVAVLREVAQGQLGTAAAAALLGVRERQARRLAAACQRAGAAGLRHGNAGRQPAHTIAPAVRARVVALAQARDRGGNHQHRAELLAEREGLARSRSSVRRICTRGCRLAPRARRPPAPSAPAPLSPGGDAGAGRRPPARLAGGARAVPRACRRER